MSFVTCGTHQVINRRIKYKQSKRWNDPLVVESETTEWSPHFLSGVSEADTYLLIFTKGPHYEALYKWFIKQPEVKILYQSPPAINTRYSPTQLRNFVVVFEWQKQVPVQNVEKTEKTLEETTLSPSQTEEPTASPVDTTVPLTTENLEAAILEVYQE